MSQTETQVGASAVTDALGHYAVSGITVGPVVVRAGKGNGAGSSAGPIDRPNIPAVIDVTIDGGSVTARGVIRKVEDGQSSPAAGAVVTYRLVIGQSAQVMAAGLTDSLGRYSFSGLPVGRCHTAMLLGAAKMLKAREAELPGVVKLLFQPAEEGAAGGKRLCEEGALETPRVQRVFGLHVWPQLKTGTIGSRAGVFLASAGSLNIVVRGVGGHAAKPNLTHDPVVTAVKIIVELQTIVAREVDPLEPAVI